MLNVQLFEQPYSDRSEAKAILENKDAAAFGADASDKAIVMLKNSGNVIAKDGMKDKPKVYIPMSYSSKAGWALPVTEKVASELFDIVTDTVGAASGEPLDKAGAYAVQGRAGAFVRSIHGSPTNVIGLPLETVARMLREAGWKLLG